MDFDWTEILDPLGLFSGTAKVGNEYALAAYFAAQDAIKNAKSEATQALKEGQSAAQAYLNAIDTSRKSAKELYQEGREVAGQAAVDKAGIAKKQAKAASSMAGASKLFSAIQGAQAATDAATSGYDETAQSAAGLAASQENAQKAAEMSKATGQANVAMTGAQGIANTAMTAGQQEAQNANTAGTNLTNIASTNAQQRNQARENRKNRAAQLGSSFLGSMM